MLEYKALHGDCRVPQHYKPNKSLGKWVAKQREQFKLKLKNQHSFLTPFREEKLNQAGFSWHIRNSLDSEVQTVMDELISNNRNALAATSASTTADNMDGSTAATSGTKVQPVANSLNPAKEEQLEAINPPNNVSVNDTTSTAAV